MPEVHYVFDPDADLDIGPHVFPVQKYRLLEEMIREEVGAPAGRFHRNDPVLGEDLERVHMPGYLEDLRLCRQSWATLQSELPVEPEVLEAFQQMVGGSIAAVRLAFEHGVGFHLGGGFHHAFPDHAEGFCFLHDIAIALERLRAEEGIGKILIVDCDVHQGNGTAVIYAGDRETFTYSIHQQRNYPPKQRSDLDRGLEDGIDDDEYLRLLGEDLDQILGIFRPEFIAYVAGVDPHAEDQLGGLGLTAEGLQRRDEQVVEMALDRGLPLAVLLAGGYNRSAETTARLHLGTAHACEAACAARS